MWLASQSCLWWCNGVFASIYVPVEYHQSICICTQTATSFQLLAFFSFFLLLEGICLGFLIVSIISSPRWLFASLWLFVFKLAYFVFTSGDLQDHGAQHQYHYSLSEPQQTYGEVTVTSLVTSSISRCSKEKTMEVVWNACDIHRKWLKQVLLYTIQGWHLHDNGMFAISC